MTLITGLPANKCWILNRDHDRDFELFLCGIMGPVGVPRATELSLLDPTSDVLAEPPFLTIGLPEGRGARELLREGLGVIELGVRAIATISILRDIWETGFRGRLN